jgi:hypothetical protein
MKKSILTISIMLTVALTTAFANNNDGIFQRAKESFNSSFNTASSVKWQQEKNFVKATFIMNDQVMNAYYNNDGDLIAITRNILSDQLPINLMADIKKNYNNHWITDLFEIAAEGQTSYYITLENADETIVLKSSDFSTWSVYKKTKRASF